MKLFETKILDKDIEKVSKVLSSGNLKTFLPRRIILRLTLHLHLPS
jgi:hypothetical protein